MDGDNDDEDNRLSLIKNEFENTMQNSVQMAKMNYSKDHKIEFALDDELHDDEVDGERRSGRNIDIEAKNIDSEIDR